MYELFSQSDKDGYENALSNYVKVNHSISSNNSTLLIPPRLPEILFSHFFSAIDLARKDIPIDNYLHNFDFSLNHTGNIGVGIKTFSVQEHVKVAKVKSEKIAEFDELSGSLNTKSPIDKAKLVSKWWNDRIQKVTVDYGIHIFKYHCIVRHGTKISIYEFPMNKIDVSNITMGSKGKTFSDGRAIYGIGIISSKSTLQRRFNIGNPSYLVSSFSINRDEIFSKEEAIKFYS